MSPAAEVLIIAQRELRKSTRSAKGMALLVLSLLGGVAAALVFVSMEKARREFLSGAAPEQIAEAQKQIIMRLGRGDDALGSALAQMPIALLGAYKVSVWLGPLLVAVLGFDAISGELQHRTVRFWTVRARRESYYVGKVLGLWMVVSGLTLLIHVLIWGIVVARGEPLGTVVEWGPRFWLATLPMTLVWCAIAQLVASQLRSPMIALLMTLMTFFVLWIAFLVGASGTLPALYWVYPNVYDDWLLHPHAERVLEGLGICVGSALAYVGAGAAVFARRDV